MSKRKLAVLGGGMGSLSAVFWLTSKPGWQDEWDITVYQLGWRLGGKAASGRARDAFDRSYEHGYHVLLGFYDNVFTTMRHVYQEWARDPSLPLAEFNAATWEEERAHPDRYAVRRHTDCQVAQEFAGHTHFIPFNVPANALVPGDGTAVDVWTAIDLLFSTLVNAATGKTFAVTKEDDSSDAPPESHLHDWMREDLERLKEGGETDIDRWLSESLPLKTAHALWATISGFRAVGVVIHAIEKLFVALINAHMRHVWNASKDKIATDWPTYRDWIVQDTLASNLCGMLADDLITKGFESVNHINYVDWLMSHAAVPEGAVITANSSLGQFPYDLVFGYRDGDTQSPARPDKPYRGSPDMEAGTMLIGLFHFMLAYKGAPEWLPQAGFGEILITPVYDVLKTRGVRIEFFSKVRQLHLDASGTGIERITIERQATPKTGTYEPTYDVKGLGCWPTEPFFDQLVEGDALRAQQINLESWWTPWQGETYEIARGTGFDVVLLGISVAALPAICGDLIATHPAWKTMLETIKTNRPLIVQAWFDKTVGEMGWPYGIMNGDVGTQPINLQTSMDQVIPKENWPADDTPKALIYYSGVFPDDPHEPAVPNAAYPKTQQDALRAASIDFLERSAHVFCPDACPNGTFDWQALNSAKNPSLQGRARFDAQYWRVNIDPTERYVLSVTGSSATRMTAGGTGIDNLFLAGDWTQTGLNAGCMEATVSSGMNASRAICGFPGDVPGERRWK